MEKAILLHHKDRLPKEWSSHFTNYNCIDFLPAKPSLPLIRWGSLVGSDSPATLNRKRALLNSLNREHSFSFLKLNRIRRPEVVNPGPTGFPVVAKQFHPKDRDKDKIIYSTKEVPRTKADFYVQYVPTIKNYRAWVFNAKVFYLEKKIPVKSNTSLLKLEDISHYETIPVTLDADSEKVTHLAVKALHVLGLDFGYLRMGIDKRNRPLVLDISPELPYNAEAAKTFVKLLDSFIAAITEPPPQKRVLMGCDPEIVMRNGLTGGLVYPSSFVEREGLFGYDERSEGRRGQLFPLAEIRPAPDYCPLRLTEKVKFALELGLKAIPYKNIEWLAGSIHFNRYQIGGHIHYSGIGLSSALLRALDNYLGIPVSLLEDPEAAAKRRRNYGGLGNIRIKPHGGFEYRTPGSWLVTPGITQAVLCLSKVLIEEFPKLKRDFFLSRAVQEAFYSSDKGVFYEFFPLLWRDLQATDTYKKYETELRVIPEMVAQRQTWNEQQDIRKTWKLPIPERVINVPK